MKTINVGVIGWGFMGKTHTQCLRSIALFYPGIDFQVKLRCICTRRIEKAREAMRDAGFETCTDNWRELIAMEDKFDVIWPSHGTPEIPADCVRKVAAAWNKVQTGELTPHEQDMHGNKVLTYDTPDCGFYCNLK